MKRGRGRWWAWVAGGAVVVAAVLAAWLLRGRGENVGVNPYGVVVEEPHPAAAPPSPARGGPVPRRGSPERPAGEGSRPLAVKDPEAGGSAVRWEEIPLEGPPFRSLGSPKKAQAVSVGIRQRPALKECARDWRWPDGIARYDMVVELRLRSEEGALVVEDALVREANVSDAEIERCVVQELRGRRIEVPDTSAGRAYRITWPSMVRRR